MTLGVRGRPAARAPHRSVRPAGAVRVSAVATGATRTGGGWYSEQREEGSLCSEYRGSYLLDRRSEPPSPVHSCNLSSRGDPVNTMGVAAGAAALLGLAVTVEAHGSLVSPPPRNAVDKDLSPWNGPVPSHPPTVESKTGWCPVPDKDGKPSGQNGQACFCREIRSVHIPPTCLPQLNCQRAHRSLPRQAR